MQLDFDIFGGNKTYDILALKLLQKQPGDLDVIPYINFGVFMQVSVLLILIFIMIL